MFKLEPVTTTNLIALFQFLAVCIGFYFSWRSIGVAIKSLETATSSLGTANDNLRTATSNAQAQVFNQLLTQGRDLQFKYLDVYASSDPKEAKRQKQDQFVGTLLSYYAGAFELRQILPMPENTKKLLDADLRQFLESEASRAKYDTLASQYSKEFNAHVRDIRGL